MTTEEPTAQDAEAPKVTWFLVSVPSKDEDFLTHLGSYPGGFSLTNIREPTFEEEDALRFGTSPQPRSNKG